jgi:DNA polymerase III epsilon subunit family exonuclease
MIEPQIIKELNENQRKAVTAPRQPVLMLAGPGTGKTRTLIARIIYEIQKYQIPPEQILALTFSNRAAAEIKYRLEKALKSKADKVRTSTFHAFCLDVLRKYHKTAGLDKYFNVCDEQYQKRLLQRLMADRVRENIERKVRSILLAFSNYSYKQKPLPAFSAMIYDEYVNHLKRHRLIDYNQILTKTLTLFQENEDVLNQYRFLNQSILIDEFQDTDPIQYQIVKLLAEKHRNIFVVADDDQSIYAWRGADPENIRQYMMDFSIEKPVFLDQNYRCGKSIMDSAQAIVCTTDRIEPDKIINSDESKIAEIQAFFFPDESLELDFIVGKIHDWREKHHVDYSDIGVIYPQHRFGERIAARLLKERIPYQQAAGRNLIDHPVMQKIILYLKLIRDPSDELILEELVEIELGYHIYKQVQNFQSINQISFRKALNDFLFRSEIGAEMKRKVSAFIGNVANLVNLKSFFSFNRLINEIIKNTHDLSGSVLKHNVSKLHDFVVDRFKNIDKASANIWVYHSDEKILFIAMRLLEKVFGKRIHPLTHDNIIHVNASDLAILLEKLNVETLPCAYESLFAKTTDRRQGILSTLLRWIQNHLKDEQAVIFKNYVVFDLETTGKNTESCGIVEIAAVRVCDGKIVDQFQTLINPGMAIEKEAQSVHHISSEDIKDAPAFQEIWRKFVDFIEDALLIAHNGYSFDFKIIDRMAREYNMQKLKNIRYDSLVLARNLYPNMQNSIDGLADRFKLDPGTRHRALDDVLVLHEIFQIMLQEVENHEAKTTGEGLTEFIALGNILENKIAAVEDKIFFTAGIGKLLSPYSEIRTAYAQRFNINDEEVKAILLRAAERISTSIEIYDTDEDFFKRILETAHEFNYLPVDQAIAEFLSYISLVNPQDSLKGIEAAALLTYHSAKGLEFDRVIIVGMEDDNMPSFFAYKSDDEDDRPVLQKIEEQKRLLYVGITRAKSEVVFTIVKNRFGREQRSSPFLDEMRKLIKINTYN